MGIGGSQMNAVELGHAVAQRGHEVVFFGPDGVLVDKVRELGLEFIEAPREHAWPTWANLRSLRRVVRERGVDVVHGYEWGACMDLAFGPHATLGTPMVNTVLSMEVAHFLPRHAPLIVGTRALADGERRHRDSVSLIEPPIDLAGNAAGRPRDAARATFGFDERETVLAVVCRLTPELGKIEGVLEAIEVVGALAAGRPLRLLLVGDGPGLDEISARAKAVNDRAGTDVVVVWGAMSDPRDAYLAADVVLGMGSSALKAMASSRPLVVQGPNGFWRLLEASSLTTFLQQGWWGTGDGDGPAQLTDVLRGLLARPGGWDALGTLGREVVERHYSLDGAAERLIEIYADAIRHRVPRAQARRSLGRSAWQLAAWKVTSRLDRTPAGAYRPQAATA